MAREHARIGLSIWSDDDFRSLTVEAQHLYLLLLSSPTLSNCGVADWRPPRIAALAADMTTAKVLEAGAELARGRYVVIDEETEEVLIRSFVRNDGLMSQPRMAVAMCKAYAGTASRVLRDAVLRELVRLHDDSPGLKGWKSVHGDDGEALGLVKIGQDLPPVSVTFGPNVALDLGSATPAPTPAPNSTTPNTAADAAEFEEFYSTYPRKVGKKAAKAKYDTARKSTDHATIMAGLEVQVARWRHDRTEEKFIPHPATWLNQGRWGDEPAVVPEEPKTGQTILHQCNESSEHPRHNWTDSRNAFVCQGVTDGPVSLNPWGVR